MKRTSSSHGGPSRRIPTPPSRRHRRCHGFSGDFDPSAASDPFHGSVDGVDTKVTSDVRVAPTKQPHTDRRRLVESPVPVNHRELVHSFLRHPTRSIAETNHRPNRTDTSERLLRVAKPREAPPSRRTARRTPTWQAELPRATRMANGPTRTEDARRGTRELPVRGRVG